MTLRFHCLALVGAFLVTNQQLLPGAATKPVIAPGATLQKVSSAFEFTEGPAVDRQGNVYFTDQPNNRILKWSPGGEITTFLEPSGRANGMYFDRRRNLLACADEKNELWSIAPDKKVTVLLKDFRGNLLNGPNDLWVRPDNALYFTDPLYKRPYWKREPSTQQGGEHVYFMSPTRDVIRRVTEDLKQPNGIIGTPDGRILYVSDIGAGRTYAYDVIKDGALKNQRLFCAQGSDGMTIDQRGNVYLTGQGVTVFDSRGEKLAHIEVPEPWTANVCFAGRDRKTLFLTAGKSVYTLRMTVRGITK